MAQDDEGILPDALDLACREDSARALYCMPTLQNPTGAVMSAERRQAIATVLRKYRLPVIEDDIYRFLTDAPPPLSAFVPELGHYLLGCSKSIARSSDRHSPGCCGVNSFITTSLSNGWRAIRHSRPAARSCGSC